MATSTSLRTHLLARVGAGIAILLLVDALLCYFTALYFANLIYDRWLVDDAMSLSRALRTDGGRVEFALGGEGLEVFRFDAVDTTYFRVRSAQRGVIAGDVELPPEPDAIGGHPRVYSARLAGVPIRVAALRLRVGSDSVTISTAETTRKRQTLTREVLLVMAVPQAVLLLIALGLSWWSITRSLRPLTQLATALQWRGYGALQAIDEASLPREALVLVSRLNELLQRVDAVVSSQQRFLADAAHQLRTPLAAVLLHADRLGSARDPAEVASVLAALRSAARRASRVSTQLLALARTEAVTDGRLALERVDLAALARRVGEEWVPSAVRQGIDFGLEVPDQPVWVRGDASLIGELLSNLLDNAFRYGRAAGAVTVAVTAQAGHAEIQVADDGPGIPGALRDQVFERFYRAPDTPGEGCGLGLSIVREIARRHGATITVAGPPERSGSLFTIRFPT